MNLLFMLSEYAGYYKVLMFDTLHYINEYPMVFAQVNVTGVSCLVKLVLLRALLQ